MRQRPSLVIAAGLFAGWVGCTSGGPSHEVRIEGWVVEASPQHPAIFRAGARSAAEREPGFEEDCADEDGHFTVQAPDLTGQPGDLLRVAHPKFRGVEFPGLRVDGDLALKIGDNFVLVELPPAYCPPKGAEKLPNDP